MSIAKSVLTKKQYSVYEKIAGKIFILGFFVNCFMGILFLSEFFLYQEKCWYYLYVALVFDLVALAVLVFLFHKDQKIVASGTEEIIDLRVTCFIKGKISSDDGTFILLKDGETRFELLLDKNMDTAKYVDPDYKYNARAAALITECLANSIVMNVHYAQKRGLIQNQEHIKYILQRIKDGCDQVVPSLEELSSNYRKP